MQDELGNPNPKTKKQDMEKSMEDEIEAWLLQGTNKRSKEISTTQIRTLLDPYDT